MNETEFSFDEMEVGHTFSPLIYPIGRELIARYADTVEDNDPLHRHADYARRAGYEGIIAPPTIAALYVLKAYRTDSLPPAGGVHVKQRFKFYRPILAGDVLHVQARVVDKYVKKGKKFLVIVSLARNQDGENTVWSESTCFWAG
jgi:3-hydroxybutyryl-CoA dehydratase